MEAILQAFVSGVILIGVITALFAPGRTTVAGFTAAGTAARGLLQTAESGK